MLAGTDGSQIGDLMRIGSLGLGTRPRRPPWPFRVRIGLSYWGLFVVSGVVLLAVTVGLWQGATTTAVRSAPLPAGVRHYSDLRQLLVMAGVALVLLAVVAIEYSLLARLERSFRFQRRFAASAAHELRTPLATMRVWLDVAAAKPGPAAPQAVALADRMRTELDRIDQLLESLLTLAHTEQGPARDEATLRLADLASAAVEGRADAISRLALDVGLVADPGAWVRGSRTLLTRMVANVIDNAVTHNEPGGWLRAAVTAEGPLACLVVDNGGPVLAQEEVSELAQPFQRLAAERTGSDRGSGLGLSIVASIAEAHGGTLRLHARREGGLRVAITLPAEGART
jgi:hypothetical protein